MPQTSELIDLMAELKSTGEPFVLATVVRTVAATAAKAGAKAVIRTDGTMSGGWIGGGCARTAVLNAAQAAIGDGEPRLISIQPEDLLNAQGVVAGQERDGVRFARNMCPSQGTMDIFVEPIMPRPELVVFGASPVASALADLGANLGFCRTICAFAEDPEIGPDVEQRIDGFELDVKTTARRFIVVATQGRGDEAALRAALAADADYVAFVGSRAKGKALCEKLSAEGIASQALDRLKCPAGLDLGAITPEEIALSILSEIVQVRRKIWQRGALRP